MTSDCDNDETSHLLNLRWKFWVLTSELTSLPKTKPPEVHGGERAFVRGPSWYFGGGCRHIEQKSLLLKITMDDSPDSEFHVFTNVSSFTLDSLKWSSTKFNANVIVSFPCISIHFSWSPRTPIKKFIYIPMLTYNSSIVASIVYTHAGSQKDW